MQAVVVLVATPCTKVLGGGIEGHKRQKGGEGAKLVHHSPALLGQDRGAVSVDVDAFTMRSAAALATMRSSREY